MLAVLFFLARTVSAAAEDQVLLDIGFDISTFVETADGINATHILRDYLADTNLLTLRHLTTLSSGTPGSTPMRTAFLEFENLAKWTAFEDTMLERTHALHDLFWVNYRRTVWFITSHLDNRPQYPDKGGFIFGFKYRVRPGQKDTWAAYRSGQINEITTRLSQGDASTLIGFKEAQSKYFHGDYDGLLMWEFDDMHGLSNGLLEDTRHQLILDNAKALLSDYAVELYVPSSSGGGFVFLGLGNPQHPVNKGEGDDTEGE